MIGQGSNAGAHLAKETLQPGRSITSIEHCPNRQVGPHGRCNRGETGSAKCPAQLDQLHTLSDELARLRCGVLHARNADTCKSSGDIHARRRGAIVDRIDERPLVRTLLP